MRLEEAQLADALRADAAGGEVGNAAGFELDADVGDVHLGRENRQAYGVKAANGRFHEAEDDIEVVDHEIKNDVDIKGARGEDAEAVRLEEHGAIQPGVNCGNGGVKALEVANGEYAVVLLGESEQISGLEGVRGDGLLDEKIDAGSEKGRGSLVMGRRGNANGCGVEVDFAARTGLEAGFDRGVDGSAPLFGERGGTRRFGLYDGGQPDGLASLLEVAVDAEMVTAEGSRAYDSDI